MYVCLSLVMSFCISLCSFISFVRYFFMSLCLHLVLGSSFVCYLVWYSCMFLYGILVCIVGVFVLCVHSVL